MMSPGVTKPSCNHPCEKCISPNPSNISLDGSQGGSSRMRGINIDGHSYANTPSPSSIASTSTNGRSGSLRDDYHPPIFSSRRYRHDKLFHRTHSLNRQYIMTMTSILFQMQKEIYKLKRRTKHVEHLLAKKTSTDHSTIRISRLPRDEVCPERANNVDNTSAALEDPESTPNIELQETIPFTSQPREELQGDKETPIVGSVEHEDNKLEEATPSSPSFKTKLKYCFGCEHEFSNRSAYLRHIRKIHGGKVPTIFHINQSPEVDNYSNDANALTTDPAVFCDEGGNESDGEPVQILINQWDIGEGRLRPRPVPKLNNERTNKVKCDICNKCVRADYLKKHQLRAHPLGESPVPGDFNDTPNPIPSNINEHFEDNQTTPSEPTTDPPPSFTTTAMETDDIPIEFPESTKPIVIAVTCLERYQSDIVEEFVRKFHSRVSQVATIDSNTTHLITNDNKVLSRSPLSMKLIEAIAHHCFCVSYRWIIDCLQYDRIIDETSYEIEGDDADYQHSNGGPRRSRLTERRHSLFQNVCFLIKCTENNDIKLTNSRLQSLITSCGGRIINCVTQDLLSQNDVIVLCDRLFVSERRHNYDQCRSLGIEFVSSDWVLGSILDYNRKPYAVFEETPL